MSNENLKKVYQTVLKDFPEHKDTFGDYEFFQEIYKEWQADTPIRHAIEDAPAFEELREERKEEDRLMAWA